MPPHVEAFHARQGGDEAQVHVLHADAQAVLPVARGGAVYAQVLAVVAEEEVVHLHAAFAEADAVCRHVPQRVGDDYFRGEDGSVRHDGFAVAGEAGQRAEVAPGRHLPAVAPFHVGGEAAVAQRGVQGEVPIVGVRGHVRLHDEFQLLRLAPQVQGRAVEPLRAVPYFGQGDHHVEQLGRFVQRAFDGGGLGQVVGRVKQCRDVLRVADGQVDVDAVQVVSLCRFYLEGGQVAAHEFLGRLHQGGVFEMPRQATVKVFGGDGKVGEVVLGARAEAYLVHIEPPPGVGEHDAVERHEAVDVVQRIACHVRAAVEGEHGLRVTFHQVQGVQVRLPSPPGRSRTPAAAA